MNENIFTAESEHSSKKRVTVSMKLTVTPDCRLIVNPALLIVLFIVTIGQFQKLIQICELSLVICFRKPHVPNFFRKLSGVVHVELDEVLNFWAFKRGIVHIDEHGS